ncbi:MAG: hypothetical protein WDO13_12675 [Verrucomicrobiota bacterium]
MSLHQHSPSGGPSGDDFHADDPARHGWFFYVAGFVILLALMAILADGTSSPSWTVAQPQPVAAEQIP